jgi:pilus assembly protein CpaB
VTLLVTPEESERLALASTQGKLQLTMRAQRDQVQVPTVGVSPPELLGAGARVAAVAPPPVAVPTHHHTHAAPAPAPAVAPAPKKEAEVVEILRGDHLEERKLRAREPQ